MAATGKLARRLPVVVILGATGTGKSKLALEMAQKFRGEIISADSMQVYQGLDIVTNKVTHAERALVPHHMIDYVSPLQTRHTVVDFRNKALPIIDAILSRDRIPIIVGGTNYYIEALLWDLLVDKKKTSSQRSPADSVASHSGENPNQPHKFPPPTPGGSTPTDAPPDGAGKNEDCQKSSASGLNEDSEEVSAPSKILRGDFEGVATPELYEELVKVDAVSSKRIHPNDRRKIIRALEVYRDEGRPLSDFLEEQHGAPGGGRVSGPLRYGLTTVMWIQCEQQVLDERTDKRVDQMIEAGLVDELSEFHDKYNQARLKENKEADYTLGIFQSIGFKEFHHYLLLSKDDRETDKGKAFFKLGVEEMKRTTRRYARKQHTWVTNRFLKRRGSEVPPVFTVSSTFPDRWQHDAHDPAAKVIEAVIEGLPPPIAPLPYEENTNKQEYNRCDVCDRVFVTTKEWTAHLKGRRHRNMLKRKKRAEGGENRNKVRKDKHGDTTTTEPADPT